jgi:hypothetical protein
MKLSPLERRQSSESTAIAEAMRRLLTLQARGALDLWLPFPQNGCTFGFGVDAPPRALPIGALFTLWRTGTPFTQRCPDCAAALRMVSFGGLLTIGGGRMICSRCDAEFYQPLEGGLCGVGSIVRAGLLGTEFLPSIMVFGRSIGSDGAALLAELELPPIKLQPQCEVHLVSQGGVRTRTNMSREERSRNWDDEQSVIDAFVGGVHGDHVELTRVAGERLVHQRFCGAWQAGDPVDGGPTLLPFHLVPSALDDSDAGLEVLDRLLPPARLNQLYEGAELNSGELTMWRRAAAEAFLNENPDSDANPAWEVLRFTSSDGTVAFLSYLAGGYSFTEPWNKYRCGSRTIEESIARIREDGFTDVDDLRSRWGSKILPG